MAGIRRYVERHLSGSAGDFTLNVNYQLLAMVLSIRPDFASKHGDIDELLIQGIERCIEGCSAEHSTRKIRSVAAVRSAFEMKPVLRERIDIPEWVRSQLIHGIELHLDSNVLLVSALYQAAVIYPAVLGDVVKRVLADKGTSMISDLSSDPSSFGLTGGADGMYELVALARLRLLSPELASQVSLHPDTVTGAQAILTGMNKPMSTQNRPSDILSVAWAGTILAARKAELVDGEIKLGEDQDTVENIPAMPPRQSV